MDPIRDHPEAEENRRRGSEIFYAVRQEYHVERGTLLGRGVRKHWYAPFVHEELPSLLAKLHNADDAEFVTFAESYGEMDLSSIPSTTIDDGFYIDADGKRSMGGDLLSILRAHCSGLHIVLTLTDALNRKADADTLRTLLDSFRQSTWAAGRVIEMYAMYAPRWQDQSPREAARDLRDRIVNDNVSRIYRYVAPDDKGRSRSFFGCQARIDVAYWHVANAIDGGVLKKCARSGCGGIFIQSDPRQRFCPKRWRQRESNCATRVRQQRTAKSKQQQGRKTNG